MRRTHNGSDSPTRSKMNGSDKSFDASDWTRRSTVGRTVRSVLDCPIQWVGQSDPFFFKRGQTHICPMFRTWTGVFQDRFEGEVFCFVQILVSTIHPPSGRSLGPSDT